LETQTSKPRLLNLKKTSVCFKIGEVRERAKPSSLERGTYFRKDLGTGVRCKAEKRHGHRR